MSLSTVINLVPSVFGSAIPSPTIQTIPLNYIQLTSGTPNPLTNVSVQATASNSTQPSSTPIVTLNEGYYFFSGDFNPQWYSTSNFDNGILSYNVSIGNGVDTYSQKVISFILNGSQNTTVPNLNVQKLSGLAYITQPNTSIYFTINSIEFASTSGDNTTVSDINGNVNIPAGSFTFSYIQF
jgi:hypothetical protein